MNAESKQIAIRMGWDPHRLRCEWTWEQYREMQRLLRERGPFVLTPAWRMQPVPCTIVEDSE